MKTFKTASNSLRFNNPTGQQVRLTIVFIHLYILESKIWNPPLLQYHLIAIMKKCIISVSLFVKSWLKLSKNFFCVRVNQLLFNCYKQSMWSFFGANIHVLLLPQYLRISGKSSLIHWSLWTGLSPRTTWSTSAATLPPTQTRPGIFASSVTALSSSIIMFKLKTFWRSPATSLLLVPACQKAESCVAVTLMQVASATRCILYPDTTICGLSSSLLSSNPTSSCRLVIREPASHVYLRTGESDFSKYWR